MNDVQFFPVTMADYGDGRRGIVVIIGTQRPSDQRRNLENLEIVA